MNSNTAMKKVSTARRVAYAGLLTALSLALLYVMYLLPTLRLSLLVLLSLLPVALAHEKRYMDAALSFAASALLSGFLFPTQAWILFMVFFGWYGIIREFIVTTLNRILSWGLLAVIFNSVLFAIYFLFSRLFSEILVPDFMKSFPLPLLILAAEVVFVLFELLFTACRDYYIKRIRKLLYR